MAFRDMPIRNKLIASFLLTSIVVLMLMSASVLAYQFFAFKRITARQLSTLGEITAVNSTAALAFENERDAREILAALKPQRNIVAAALYDADGDLFSHYPAELPATLLPPKPGRDGYQFERSSWLIGFQPVVERDRRLGTLYLKFDTGKVLWGWFFDSMLMALVVMAVALLVAYMLSRMLQRQISGPILSLAETARHISEKRDFSVRARKYGHDEIGRLTDGFNQVLSGIQEREGALRHANDAIQDLNVDLDRRVKERTAQLEAANNELEAFSYTVSHDLRAPLRSMDGFSQAVLEDFGPLLPEEGQRYLQTIRDSAQRMGELIDDLLAFAKLGRQSLNKQPVATDPLVRGCLAELESSCQGRKVDVRLGELPACLADPALLRQVWINLLSNALKYTRMREAAVVEIGCERRDDRDIYFVRDNGTGFDMKYVDKLFGVFQRLHRVEDFEGTGVGLAIVQRIIQRHHGRIWPEATPGQGATFYFFLPATLPPQSSLP
jgi:signal transduction histidine kinase